MANTVVVDGTNLGQEGVVAIPFLVKKQTNKQSTFDPRIDSVDKRQMRNCLATSLIQQRPYPPLLLTTILLAIVIYNRLDKMVYINFFSIFLSSKRYTAIGSSFV